MRASEPPLDALAEVGDGGRWRLGRIAGFAALALALHLTLLAWSETLVRRTGDRNPFFRIEAGPPRVDWVILGASHAMPLDFDDAEAGIEAATGRSLLNLAATGAGPFVQRLVAERFLMDHEAGAVLVVVDAFAFDDRRWNEDRVGDTDFLPRVPFDPGTLATLARAVPRGLPGATLADYATGLTKIANPDRRAPDIWKAEARFDGSPRPSDAADQARADYLWPGPPDLAERASGLADLSAIVALAQARGARVVLVRPPLPERFRRLRPDDPAFDAALAALAGRAGVPLLDHAGLMPEPRLYLDSDHLNRAGVAAWVAGGLGDVLSGRVDDAGQ